jgi:RNA-directed DNA polymerase
VKNLSLKSRPKSLSGHFPVAPLRRSRVALLRRSLTLGFTHYMTRSRKAGVRLGRKTIGKRHRSTLIAMNDKLRKLRNLLSFRELHVHLCRVLKGYYNYYGFAGNATTLNKFAYAVERKWFKWLNRRSQRQSFNWEEFQERLKRFPLPRPRIVKDYSWIYATGM